MNNDANYRERGERGSGVVLVAISIVVWGVLVGAIQAKGAGILTPVGSAQEAIEIRDHHLSVTINNGFARTEVVQTFFNPNAMDLEAIYAFPVPQHACLSELTIYAGERELHGEVLSQEAADRIYGEEKSKGNDAGKAQKSDYETFEFYVTPVRAQDVTRLRFVYYEPIEVDTGIGRYVYPLENGGTDECGRSFWMPNEVVRGGFSAEIELKLAWPVADVRLPGFEAAAAIEKLDEGHYRAEIQTREVQLNRDIVFYYRLADDLPGRVELIPYRPDAQGAGTFMLVVTPGVDLKPLAGGADYVFVLDVSGSMRGKIQTLARGVSKVLGEMAAGDRFRVVLFNNVATELTGGWTEATTSAAAEVNEMVRSLATGGSTNLYAGVQSALRDLDADRVTSVVLVTDGVTNTGVIAPRAFHDLLSQYDVRFFGFLMGNNSNWPLMRLIADTSGGFYASVSNADDIVGQIMLAKSKVLHECMHDVELAVDGVDVFDMTDGALGKVYRGEQMVLFGRYAEGGTAQVSLLARMSGEDRTYTTTFEFPDVAVADPEIERLWAMNRIEAVEMERSLGLLPGDEAATAVRDLGVAYQLVTDETSMVALPDEVFEAYGIERRNAARVAEEVAAQSEREVQPIRNYRVDRQKPMFERTAPRPSQNGGGAIDPLTALIALGLGGASVAGRTWRSERRR